MSKIACIAILSGLLAVFFAPTACADVHLISSSEAGAEISADRYRVKLRFTPDPEMNVVSVLRDGSTREIVSFPLEGFAVSGSNSVDTKAVELVSVTKELKTNSVGFTITYASSSRDQHEVVLRFDRTFFSYQLSVIKGQPREITELRYLTGISSDGQVKYGRGTFDQVRTWTSDLYEVLIPDTGLSHLSLPPREERDDPGYIRGQQAGSPLVPPYVAAVRSGDVWWGIGTIGIPNTYNGLGLEIGRSSLTARYETASQTSAQETGISGPTLGFYFADNADEILVAYRASLPSITLGPGIASAEWWSQPIYCTWGDQVYESRMRAGQLDEGSASRYATDKNVDRWLAIAAREQLSIGTVILDLGWMSGFGDFEPDPNHFSDLRAYIDKLHAKKLHVLLWIPMYEATGSSFNLAKLKSDVATKHPDWLVHTRGGRLTDIFDYTNPDAREYLRSRIHYMLSAGIGGMNADGLKVDFIDRVPNPAESTFYDPSWGIGEAMSARVMELIYGAAKEAKADALVDSSFMNPLFHAWQDVVRLNDDVSNAVETYWWRAWAASVNGVRLIDGDDWWAMQRYFVPLTLAKSAWGIPNLYALEYRGAMGTDASAGAASGGYPVEISQDSYRQVKAILDVYRHAPAASNQEPTVDPIHQQAGRIYKNGPLKGFYAAQTLNFGRVLVAYRPHTAKLTSIAAGDVAVPLPGGFLAKKVSALGFDGKKRVISFLQRGGCVHFSVEDSAKGIHSYEIEYEKASRSHKHD